MLKEQKESLLRTLKRAKTAGDESAQRIQTAVHKAVSRVRKSDKRSPNKVKQAAKEITTIAIKDLEKTGDATRAHVAAVISGAVEGAKEIEQKALATAHKKQDQLRREIKQREEDLARDVGHALEGVSETAKGFSGAVKKEIQASALDAKVKSADLLGLMEDTVKAAIRRAIQGGKNVEKTVEAIACNTVKEALATTRVSAEKVRTVSDSVIAAAVKAAEETGANALKVGRAAVQGTQKGIANAVEDAEQKLAAGSRKAKSSTKQQLKHLKEEFGRTEEALVIAVRGVAHRSGETLQKLVNELADDLANSASRLKRKGKKAADKSMKHLKAIGKEAAAGSKKVASLSVKEAKELGTHALERSKAAASDMTHRKHRGSRKAA